MINTAWCTLWFCACLILQCVAVVLCIRQNGALGSRLTGAGWGGCVVSLVPADKLQSFITSMNAAYYSEPSRAAVVSDCLFASQPGDGAALFVFWWSVNHHITSYVGSTFQIVYSTYILLCFVLSVTDLQTLRIVYQTRSLFYHLLSLLLTTWYTFA